LRIWNIFKNRLQSKSFLLIITLVFVSTLFTLTSEIASASETISIEHGMVGLRYGDCPPETKDDVCWLNYDPGDDWAYSRIRIDVEESGGKGLGWCNITYTIGDGPVQKEKYSKINGENEWEYIIDIYEDGQYKFNVTCSDTENKTVSDVRRYKVDGTPPVTKKNFSGDFRQDNNTEWITENTEIYLNAEDPDPTGQNVSSGLRDTWYRIREFSDRYCENPQKYCQSDYIYGEDPYEACYSGDIWRAAEYCKNYEDEGYETYKECMVKQVGSMDTRGGKWNFSWNEPINVSGESCHVMEYFSADHTSSTENLNYNCFFVEKEDFNVNKTVGKPKVKGIDEDWWVTTDTDIEFRCGYTDRKTSGNEELCFKLSNKDDGDVTKPYCKKYGNVTEDGWCCNSFNEKFTFNFNRKEGWFHELEYYCKDGNKTSEREIQTYRVDDTPPVINKTIVGEENKDWLGDCPPKEGDKCYLGPNSGVNVSVEDPKLGKNLSVGDPSCSYEVEYKDDVVDNGNFSEEGTDIIFENDSLNILRINCEDGLGNKMENVQKYLVDYTPPDTWKTYGEPTKHDEEDGYRWITSDTPITLNATDEKIGVEEIKYRYCLSDCYGSDADCSCEDKNWTTVEDNTTTFTIPEDSEHCIEYYSVDEFGNEEDVKSQCVYVDNKAPESDKTTGEPKIQIGDGEWWVTQNTPIELDCEDQMPHPSGEETLHWRFGRRDEEDGETEWEDWENTSYEGFPVQTSFEEDCWHDVQYYCEDSLGNAEETKMQSYTVDTEAPNINTTIFGPSWGCDDEEGGCYIDGKTEIQVDANDPEPHPVGNVTCDWEYDVVDGHKEGEGETNVEPPFNIDFPEESTHKLKITCRDALGNSRVKEETYMVDKTVPGIDKNYEGPYIEKNGMEWISSETNVSVEAYDRGDHQSGMSHIEYRTTVVNDSYCEATMDTTQENGAMDCSDATGNGEWTTVDGDNTNFNIGEESCHLIEVNATNNVDKEASHKQCVFVDNSAPEPVKEVGEPKTEWDGQDANYYDIGDRCWSDGEDSIHCWKLTTMTPIELSCEDSQPHPVGEETLSFKVDYNGEDATEQYCEEYGEGMNADGWCYGMEAGEKIYFQEECEHNLQYRCSDGLGNEGEAEDQKYKVEGSSFNISLNKKWNLISVPFVMLENSVDEAFENVEDDIISVWAYDSANDEWLVYSPDGNNMSNSLDELHPGWGYWVLTENETTLKIGGSLFQPGKTPPSKELTSGWNLIGYYGKNSHTQYNGPVGSGQPSYCELYSLIDTTVGYPKWSSLVTYWEEDNPNQWKYLNQNDNMDPGAGYWIEMNEPESYSFSTTCYQNGL